MGWRGRVVRLSVSRSQRREGGLSARCLYRALYRAHLGRDLSVECVVDARLVAARGSPHGALVVAQPLPKATGLTKLDAHPNRVPAVEGLRMKRDDRT